MTLSIAAFQPLAVGTSLLDDAIGERIDGYSHEIYANGGYWAAQFTISDRQGDIEDWFANGLMRHIIVYNPGMVRVWVGFVNQVGIALGSLTAVRGPIVNVANRVQVVYQTISYNTTPPIAGNRAVTDTANNTTSQASYGILEETLNGGTGTETEMEQVRDTYLAEYAEPETSQQVNTGSEQKPTVTISCLGYVHLLDKYYYRQTTNNSTETITTKLQLVLASDPNSLFSTDYSQIATNALTVGQYEDEEQKAWPIIKDLVARGDASDNRYTFGIYNDQRAVYAAVPTTVLYEHRIGESGQRITRQASGATVQPWDVVPAEWLFIPDFLIGQSPTTDLRSDVRNLFIESVRYTAPWNLEINGGKVSKLSQILAKKGLGGI